MRKPENQALQAIDTQENAKGPGGRPTLFSEALAAHICGRIATGETLVSICRTPGLPATATVYRWKRENPEFSNDYATARVDQMEAWSDEIIIISDDSSMDTVTKRDPKGREFEAIDHENIQRSRLMVDTRKWIMAKIAPRYADKVAHEHSGEVIQRVEFSDRERMRRLATFLLQDQRADTSDSAIPAGVTIEHDKLQASPAEPKD